MDWHCAEATAKSKLNKINEIRLAGEHAGKILIFGNMLLAFSDARYSMLAILANFYRFGAIIAGRKKT